MSIAMSVSQFSFSVIGNFIIKAIFWSFMCVCICVCIHTQTEINIDTLTYIAVLQLRLFKSLIALE